MNLAGSITPVVVICLSVMMLHTPSPAQVAIAKGPAVVVGSVVEGRASDNRTDPGLRYLLGRQAASRGADISPPEQARAVHDLQDQRSFFRLFPGPSTDSPEILAFVRFEDGSVVPRIDALGGRILSEIRDIITVRLPLSTVASIAALPGIHSIQLSGTATPALDLSRTEAKVDVVHAGGGGLDHPYKGNGVVVGVLDSGIDWSHPDFSSSPNNSRIRYLFDYSSGTDGREWTKAQIDAGTCDAIDGPGGRGHGTHVAGTAAGGGRARSTYIGMAPEADIIAVKGSRDVNSGGGFTDVDIVNGTQYIFSRARSLDEPAVINLSLGGHLGPHDGTSLLDRSISNLVGPGKIVVASAGNEGSAFIHVGYAAQAGTGYTDALETLVLPDPGATQFVADMWYPGPPASVSVGIAAYLPGNYGSVLAVTTPVAPGQAIENVTLQSGGDTLGVVTIDARTLADPNNGARRVLFLIADGGAGNMPGLEWSIYTFGSGTFDMWGVTGGRFAPIPGLPSYFHQGDNEKSVGSPATARNVIAVGSYVSKNSWIDIDDSVRVQPGDPTIGDISSFSSHGPSRDGRVLPHVAAPGEAILAALSSSLTIGTDLPRADVLQGGFLQKLQGTSMAAPHVTGVVALMLERNRYLTPENATQLLSFTATPVGTIPNTVWGSGKMRAVNAVLATPPAIDCATLEKIYGIDCDGTLPTSTRLLPPYPNPFNPTTSIAFQTKGAGRVEVGVYDLLGRRVRILVSEIMPAGFHRALWNGATDGGSIAGSGVYLVRLQTQESSSSQRVVLIK